MSEGFKAEAFRGGNTARRSSEGVLNKNVILVDKDLCEKLENAHYAYNSSANVEKMFLDSHRNDVNGDVVNSPIFKEYHRHTIEAMQEYEELKSELVDRYNLYEYDWRMNFKNCQVVLDY